MEDNVGDTISAVLFAEARNCDQFFEVDWKNRGPKRANADAEGAFCGSAHAYLPSVSNRVVLIKLVSSTALTAVSGLFSISRYKRLACLERNLFITRPTSRHS